MANRNSSPYASAGWLLNEHIEKRRGLKSIAFDGGSKKKGGSSAPSVVDKATYATVCKTLQHLSTINSILNANNKKLRKAIDFDSVRSKGLLYVMLYELLFGKYKSIRGGGKIKRLIMKHESELRKEAEVYGTEDVFAGVNFPRYIRVNTLHTNTTDVVDKLKKHLLSKEEVNEEGASTQAIYADPHVPDLLVLSPTTSSWLHHDYNPVQSGQIVLQDKSSCFSALVMANGLGEQENGTSDDKAFDYIDACAAPGNKTCHLAALVNSSLNDNDDSQSKKKKKKNGKNKPKSTIYAFERSSTRYNILQERMNKLVPHTTAISSEIKVEVEPIHGDFLRADPSDPKFANVRAIMLDPSCSGSGIVNSPDRWMEESGSDGNKKDDKRIQSLSNFQLVALKHAMSFPNVDRIVYSTCSVYDEENEGVVSKALSEVVETSQHHDGSSWQLMAPKCLEDWKRRGKVGGIGGLSKDQADCLVRCDGMDGDETNGFFVAFFVRKKLLLSSSENERKKIDDVGVPIYNGQFVDMCKTVTQEADGDTKKLASNVDASKQQSRKEPPIPLQNKKKNDDTTTAGDKKSAKKREKKMAWKRKQALLKSQRLKKKEDAATAAKGEGSK